MARSYLSGYQGMFNPGVAATIASSGTKSSVVNCGGMALVGFYTPAALTGTAFTFEACDTVDGTYRPVKAASGSAISYTVAAAGYYAVDPKDFQGIQFLKIVSGSAEGADRIITCTLKGL